MEMIHGVEVAVGELDGVSYEARVIALCWDLRETGW